MAIFGYNEICSSDRGLKGEIDGAKYQITEGGTADSITIYLLGATTGEKVKCAIYDNDGNLVDSTEERSDINSDGWHTFDFSSPPTLIANEYYYLLAWADSSMNTRWEADTDVLVQGWTKIYTGTFPETYDKGHDFSGYRSSIYCTYTPAPVGTNMKINIGDVFKDIESLKINIGDAWKNVIKVQQNIGDVWKDVFG